MFAARLLIVVVAVCPVFPRTAIAQAQYISPSYLVGSWSSQGNTTCDAAERFTKDAVYKGLRRVGHYSIVSGNRIQRHVEGHPTARIFHSVKIIDQDHYLIYRVSSNTGAPSRDVDQVRSRCKHNAILSNSSELQAYKDSVTLDTDCQYKEICYIKSKAFWGQPVLGGFLLRDASGKVTNTEIDFPRTSLEMVKSLINSRFGSPLIDTSSGTSWLKGEQSIMIRLENDRISVGANFLITP